MKKILYTLPLCLFFSFGFAQDVIIKKDGTEIKAKVTEVLPDAIKYKEQSNLDGPLYTIPLTEVFKINYSNGTSRFYGDKKEVPTSNISKYDSLMKVSKSNKSWGIVGCVTGPIFIASGITLMVVGDGDLLYNVLGGIQIGCGTLLTILGPIEIVKSRRQYEAAQKYKAAGYITPPMPVINFASGKPGIGIGTTIRF